MGRSQRFLPQPTLVPEFWKRHSWNQLRHRSGAVVTFHGANATRRQNECLKQLWQMKRQGCER